jgi:predicted 3-demethylubiquinone-9 3-methyltransferase (glyoxalase superfamily)
MAISAGPVLKYNEAISFLIPCDTQEEIDFY